ncbi:MAG: hypothetical protein Tp118SUR00d2C21406231_64 [Prokaryotic dsDNA virus sp.]|nr:MAG: hypothetical protein Tp125DCM00d2C40298531_5 [Prokaryotic dsDNA virus sp.]QDP53184.1 MAG: hypothetical protein Tp118SUR00d2C21406231_64 [Prokaryotic dsDNA virus sp.]|tara:strand:+ start:34611 stop:34763 length:153 start_codon:yes stop_codon:yes gene_type:complete
MTVALNQNEILIIRSALQRIEKDNRLHNCAVSQEFYDLLVKIESAARLAA